MSNIVFNILVNMENTRNKKSKREKVRDSPKMMSARFFFCLWCSLNLPIYYLTLCDSSPLKSCEDPSFSPFERRKNTLFHYFLSTKVQPNLGLRINESFNSWSQKGDKMGNFTELQFLMAEASHRGERDQLPK